MIEFETIKAELLAEFSDNIKAVIEKNQSLPELERGIRKALEKGEMPTLLINAYKANAYVTAREYRDNIGDKYKVFKYDDYISEVLSNTFLFNEQGYYLGEKNEVVITITIHEDITLDLCFGKFRNIKSNIMSELFTLFYRTDLTDMELFKLIKKWREMSTYKEKQENYRALLAEGLIFRRDW